MKLASLAIALFAFGAADEGRLPVIEAETLAGGSAALPADLGAPAIILIGFDRSHGEQINEWIGSMGLDAEGAPAWRQVTVLGDQPGPARFVVRNAMKSQIKSDASRQRTLLLFEDESGITAALGIGSTEELAVATVSAEGEVLAIVRGPYSADKAETLRAAL